MSLIPEKLQVRLRANWRKNLFENNAIDLKPVAKIFSPDAPFTALITELSETGQVYGLFDWGNGRMQCAQVPLIEIEKFRGMWGCPVELDTEFKAKMPLSGYVKDAAKLGRIAI